MRPVILWLVVLGVYALTAGGHLYSPDEEIVFRVTRSLGSGEGFAIEPLGGGDFTRKPSPPRADGREYAQYGIGQPIAALPFYWIGVALSHIGSDAVWQRIYAPAALDGSVLGYTQTAHELAPRWAISWFNIFISAWIAVLVWWIAVMLLPKAPSAVPVWTAFLYAFGTMAWPHSRPFFTEAFATGCALFAFGALLKAKSCETKYSEVFWCALAGTAAGYGALVRMDTVLIYPSLAILLLDFIHKRRIPWAQWLAFCIPAALCGCILLGLNALRFGGIFETGYSDQPEGVKFTTPLAAGLYGFLMSAGKGLFFFSPSLILSFLGWRWLWARRSQWKQATAITLAIVIPLMVHSKWQNWPGGWCWGPRHIFIIHAFLALPIAFWLARTMRFGIRQSIARGIAVAVLVAGITVQLIGSSQDFISFFQTFFRSPGSHQGFYVVYDMGDMAYWSQYYQLQFRTSPNDAFRAVALYPPRPIQDSIYLPQWSVWEGYPRMIAEGKLDNFWINLIHPEAGR